MAATSKGSAVLTLPNDTDILITREFDAPALAVWRVFTEADYIRRWWGGKQGPVTSVEIDLRPGGRYRYVQDSDGFEVAFHGEFVEVVPAERLVHTEVFEGTPDGDSPPTLNTYSFSERDGRTTLELRTHAPSKEVRDAIIDSGMEVGMQEGFDLAEELALAVAGER
jgi:uncharacterized protein YndB with AHSA1/START domain